jgi:hypothetical protein
MPVMSHTPPPTEVAVNVPDPTKPLSVADQLKVLCPINIAGEIASAAPIASETKENFFIVLSSRIIPSGNPLCICNWKGFAHPTNPGPHFLVQQS